MESRPLGHHFLRTAWLFQAIVAGPIFFFLGIAAVLNMFNTYDTLSDFITHLCSSLLAGGIIYLVSIQRKLSEETTSTLLTLRFEIAKAVLATALWVWLLLDAIFADHYSRYHASRTRRIIAAAISSLLLFVLFFPAVFYAVRDRRRNRSVNDDASAAANERTALLGEEEA